VVKVLTTTAEDPGFKTQRFHKLSVHPAVNEYHTLFRGGEGEAVEKRSEDDEIEEWHAPLLSYTIDGAS